MRSPRALRVRLYVGQSRVFATCMYDVGTFFDEINVQIPGPPLSFSHERILCNSADTELMSFFVQGKILLVFFCVGIHWTTDDCVIQYY